jgi:hypothetical protein
VVSWIQEIDRRRNTQRYKSIKTEPQKGLKEQLLPEIVKPAMRSIGIRISEMKPIDAN